MKSLSSGLGRRRGWIPPAGLLVLAGGLFVTHQPPALQVHVSAHAADHYDISPPLTSLRAVVTRPAPADCGAAPSVCGAAPPGVVDDDDDADQAPAAQAPPAPPAPVTAAAASAEQKAQGSRPPMKLAASFDGLGAGFNGPQGASRGNNPSDNSLAVGRDAVVQIVNTQMAVFSRTGQVLYGAAPTNVLFKGFGGPCEERPNGDAVVRYDQLAHRWLYVMPIFRRIAGREQEPYSVCYALSTTEDPLGPYARYEFRRRLFPDYPRPAVWPDGYYIATSTGDEVIQKHACIVDRARMLVGGAATEQCIIIDGVNFLNNADIDGQALPPAGAPNIMMAAGGAQLKKIFEDDTIYSWKVHVDWQTPANTRADGPLKIAVAPYHYLCDGQLSRCVPQPGSDVRLDAQGDKIMQRLVYRNIAGRESIVAVHSVNTSRGSGGVRWYEFRLDRDGFPQLVQQSTYAPDSFYRWMASPGMDRQGNIAIGYSFGGAPNFPGQRATARLASDPAGQMTFQETVVVEGEAAQARGNRWQDYTTTAMDPADDCTFWYVGDYIRKGNTTYTTRIAGFRVPGCLNGSVAGSVYLDLNHNGKRDSGEPGIGGRRINYSGGQSGQLTSDSEGNFAATLPADPVYFEPSYNFSAPGSAPVNVRLKDREELHGVDLAISCAVTNKGGNDAHYWSSGAGKTAMRARDGDLRTLVNSTLAIKDSDGSRLTLPTDAKEAKKGPDLAAKWLGKSKSASTLVLVTALNVNIGGMDGGAAVQDPVRGDWPTIRELITRANSDPEKYSSVLNALNSNSATTVPSACGQ